MHRIEMMDRNKTRIVPAHGTLSLTHRRRLSLIRVSPGTRPPIYHVISCSGFLCRRGGRTGRVGRGRIGIRAGRVHFKPRASRRSCRFGLGRTGRFLGRNGGMHTCIFFHNHSVLFGRRNRILLLHFTGSLRRYNGMRRVPGLRKGGVFLCVDPGGTNATGGDRRGVSHRGQRTRTGTTTSTRHTTGTRGGNLLTGTGNNSTLGGLTRKARSWREGEYMAP